MNLDLKDLITRTDELTEKIPERNSKCKYCKDADDHLVCYSDADWGNEIIERLSITGNCIKLQGGVISWTNKRQGTVALPTTEAEYISLSSITQEIIWLRELIKEIDYEVIRDAINIYCDNNGAVQLTNNKIISNKSKHIDIRQYFIRQHVSNSEVHVEYLAAEAMLADQSTKPLPKAKHEFLVIEYGLSNSL
ncbi:hypothetical protein QE152_g8301 [Popillia japonica]|uniref:Polyprotein n=1 Tax=Popillia japonica TaxID=7064 RepID=A0AAW1MC36_POPJA